MSIFHLRVVSGQMTAVPFIPAYSAEKPLREKSNLLNGFNLIWVVQPALQKFPASN